MYIKTLITTYYKYPTQWNEEDHRTCQDCQTYLDDYDFEDQCVECWEKELDKELDEINDDHKND